MPSRTVLVTGATGLLGRQIKGAFELEKWTVKGTGYSRADGVDILKVDLTNEAEVENIISEVKYVHACSSSESRSHCSLSTPQAPGHRAQ